MSTDVREMGCKTHTGKEVIIIFIDYEDRVHDSKGLDSHSLQYRMKTLFFKLSMTEMEREYFKFHDSENPKTFSRYLYVLHVFAHSK